MSRQAKFFGIFVSAEGWGSHIAAVIFLFGGNCLAGSALFLPAVFPAAGRRYQKKRSPEEPCAR